MEMWQQTLIFIAGMLVGGLVDIIIFIVLVALAGRDDGK